MGKAVNNEIIDELVQKLQQEIEAQALEQFGEKFFLRWKQPKYMDAMADPDVISLLKGSCGDSLMLFVKEIINRQDRVRRDNNGETTLVLLHVGGCCTCKYDADFCLANTIRRRINRAQKSIHSSNHPLHSE